jgi:hypothetical protein
VPFADPNMAEIHKVHKSDSDPLEPGVTRFKSRALNIDDLIKGTEVNASSSDSEYEAEPSSDAPRGLVTAVNKKRKSQIQEGLSLQDSSLRFLPLLIT